MIPVIWVIVIWFNGVMMLATAPQTKKEAVVFFRSNQDDVVWRPGGEDVVRHLHPAGDAVSCETEWRDDYVQQPEK